MIPPCRCSAFRKRNSKLRHLASIQTPAVGPDCGQIVGKRWHQPALLQRILFAGSIFAAVASTTDVDLATMTNSVGFRMNGRSAYDKAGYSVCNLGDVNGDGFSDIIVGSFGFDLLSPSRVDSGISYVLFGHHGNVFADSSLSLMTTGPNTGFRIFGAQAGDMSGHSVSDAGDVNNDGRADIIMGAVYAKFSTRGSVGVAYIIFGRSSFSDIDMATWTPGPTQGFVVVGAAASDQFSVAVAGAGDVNGDGFDDVIIGANLATYSTRTNTGTACVVFGRASLPALIDFATWTPTTSDGFKLFGVAGGDQTGRSLRAAGDFNGDGIADVLLGAFAADPLGRADGGIVFMIYGRSTFPTSMDLASWVTSAVNGFRLLGATTGDWFGTHVSGAGDVNGDGVSDIIIGSNQFNAPAGADSGAAYVIFGRVVVPSSGNVFTDMDMASFVSSETTGFRVLGAAANALTGWCVSTAGDLNDDGFSDVVIGAHGSNPTAGKVGAGIVYVIYGHGSDIPFADIDLRYFVTSPMTGYRILGALAGDGLGYYVRDAGDMNDDGLADVLVGAPYTDQPGQLDAGTAYVIFGVPNSPTSQPSGQPSGQPSRQPTCQPVGQPTSRPTSQPTRQPSGRPSRQPTAQPTQQPNSLPSVQPSAQPTGRPTRQPSAQPSAQPSMQPSTQPTSRPSVQPSAYPTVQPSSQPSSRPTTQPTSWPSVLPSSQPTARPSGQPSTQPRSIPTAQPSMQPSSVPSAQPSRGPSSQPTERPTGQPSVVPSAQPSATPTSQPSQQPSSQPSHKPSTQPTSTPSVQPSAQPSARPSSCPSVQPSLHPTTHPTACPTVQPSSHPSTQPSTQPSSQPTTMPSEQPSSQPTVRPSCTPSGQPTATPSTQPSTQPTTLPSAKPSGQPSLQPSTVPSAQPAAHPTSQPSTQPTVTPSAQPSVQPSQQPIATPSCQPTSVPTSAPVSTPPTVEYTTLVYDATIAGTFVTGDYMWVCSDAQDTTSAQCKTITTTEGNVEQSYTFPWDVTTSVFTTTTDSTVYLSGSTSGTSVSTGTNTTSSAVAVCATQNVHLSCTVRLFADITIIAASYNRFVQKAVYIGTYASRATVLVVDSTGNVRTVTYTTSTRTLRSITLSEVQHVPHFIGSFVAGPCVSNTAAAQNLIFTGWVRTDTGTLNAAYLTVTGGTIQNSAELVNGMAVETSGPDSFLVGGLELSDDLGMCAYMVRINTLFRSVKFGVRYVQALSPTARRVLLEVLATTSAIQSVALVDNNLYCVVQYTSANTTSSAVLLVDAATGAIVHQVSMYAINSSLRCFSIQSTPPTVTITCNTYTTDVHVQAVVIAADMLLTFSALPSGVFRGNDTFRAERVDFRATPLSMTAATATLAVSSYVYDTSNQQPIPQSTAAPTTAVPTSRPLHQPSSQPSTQPSSSPTSAPSVSSQPSSQPSTSGPTGTHKPSAAPSAGPTPVPSVVLTAAPTAKPSIRPSLRPTQRPTTPPTLTPSILPTTAPTCTPSLRPTRSPTVRPTRTGTTTHMPTVVDTGETVATNGDDNIEGIPPYVIGAAVGGVLLVAVCGYALFKYRKHTHEEKERAVRKVAYFARQELLVAQMHAEHLRVVAEEEQRLAEKARRKAIREMRSGRGGGAYAVSPRRVEPVLSPEPVQVPAHASSGSGSGGSSGSSVIVSSLHSSEMSCAQYDKSSYDDTGSQDSASGDGSDCEVNSEYLTSERSESASSAGDSDEGDVVELEMSEEGSGTVYDSRESGWGEGSATL